MPDGTATHAWQRAEEFDLAQYQHLAANHDEPRRIALTAKRQRDCDEENRDCINKCMDRPLPRGYGHITSNGKLGGKEKYCNDQCWQPYRDCIELEKLKPQEFTTIDNAIDWLKHHHETISVGSAVTIAGITFIVVSVTAGMVLLAPVLLLAGTGTQTEPFMARVSP